MTTQAQPITAAFAAEALRLNSRPWADVFAGIPAWHPRNESAGGAPAAAGGQGEGGAPEGGQEGGGDPSLYAPYLEGVPGELHPMVLDPLQRQSADFNKKFMEAAEFRKSMEPYQQIPGFTETDPESMAELVQFGQVLQSALAPGATPEQQQPLIDTVQALSQHLGLTPELDQESWQALGKEQGWLDGEGSPEGEQQPDIMAQVQQMLDERLSPFQQQQAQMEQQQLQQQATQEFQSRYDELVAEHGLVPEDASPEDAAEIQGAIVDLAHAYVADPNEPDPLGKAVERYLSIQSRSQGDLIDGKLQQQNGPALAGGSAATAAEQSSWNGNGPDPKSAALARMRG